MEFLLGKKGDMVEKGLVLVAIVIACVGLWFTLGNKLAAALSSVVNSF